MRKHNQKVPEDVTDWKWENTRFSPAILGSTAEQSSVDDYNYNEIWTSSANKANLKITPENAKMLDEI